MYTAKAFIALLVITAPPLALSKASNVVENRGLRQGFVADESPPRGGGPRVERSALIDGTVEKNRGDDVERSTSVGVDYAVDELDSGPPVTRLADGGESNTAAPSRAGEEGVPRVATKVRTNLRRRKGRRSKRRLRFDIPVEDTPMEDEAHFRRTTQPTETPLLATPSPTAKPTNFHRTSNPTSSPSYDTKETLTMENPTTEPPTEAPTMDLTTNPITEHPTKTPTSYPTTNPTSERPTESPTTDPTTRPTSIPSTSPTTVLYCPPVYDYTKTDYAAGDTVEVDLHIFVCSSGPHEPFCNVADGSVLDGDEKKLWIESWVLVCACYRTEAPSESPTIAASEMPSTVESDDPSMQQSGAPSFSVHPSIVPSLEPSLAKSSKPSSRPSTHPSLITDNPTTAPTFPPSNSPTNIPTTIGYCPPAYNNNKTDYIAGERVDVDLNVFECAGGEIQSESNIYEPYCNIADPSLLTFSELELWNVAWTYVGGPCYRLETPSESPSLSPIEKPAEMPTTEPSREASHSGQPSAAPTYAISPSPSQHPSKYMTDSTTALSTIMVEAESYLYMQGVQTEDTSDVGGGKNVGYIDTGDWISYQEVTIPSTGTYRVEYRVACGSSGGSLRLEKADGTHVYGSVSIQNTGGYQKWQTVSHTVTMNAGPIAFGIKAIVGGWNINWFRIIMGSLLTTTETEPTTHEPSSTKAFPTNNSPTNIPTTIGYCPPAYNHSKTDYVAGERIDVDLNVFECAGGEIQTESYVYEPYCNIADPSLLTFSELELWNVAWTYMGGPCYRLETPSESPSLSPTENPAKKPTAQPSGEASHSGQPSAAPTYAVSSSPSQHPSKHMTDSPTALPSLHPTQNPSHAPIDSPSLPPSVTSTTEPSTQVLCPESYDLSNVSSYKEGLEVEVNHVIYRCKEAPWAFYCSSIYFRPQLDSKKSPQWKQAWLEVGPCVSPPTISPSSYPTSKPTHTRSPTNKPSPMPSTDNPTTLTPTSSNPTTITPSTLNPPTDMPTFEPTNIPTLDIAFSNLIAEFPHPYPYVRFTSWSRLSSEDREIAGNLGYDRVSWDNLEISDLEFFRYSDLTTEEKLGIMSLGMDANMWDCYMNHYKAYHWAHLQVLGVSSYLETLGYSESSWDDEVGYVATEDMRWYELSAEEQDAAYKLCYFENSWDWISLNNW